MHLTVFSDNFIHLVVLGGKKKKKKVCVPLNSAWALGSQPAGGVGNPQGPLAARQIIFSGLSVNYQ